MFISKRKHENQISQISREAYEKGWDAAVAQFEKEFFSAANQVALEATRSGPTDNKARTYKTVYEEVYDSLDAKHRS